MHVRSLAITAMWLTLAGGAGAKTLIIPPRPGQVGLSVQAGYSGFTTQGSIGEDFGQGPGLAVRVRYRMRYERAIGLSFEGHSFDARTSAKFTDPLTGLPLANNDPLAPARVTLITSGVDFYKMFGTRTNTTRMVSASAGLAQVRTTLNDNETDFHLPDGVYLGAGAAVERFFWRSWAFDMSGRYLAVFEDGKTNHQLQAAVGLIVYASY
jgi:hypothetical protein